MDLEVRFDFSLHFANNGYAALINMCHRWEGGITMFRGPEDCICGDPDCDQNNGGDD